jgi:hypothetical protein
MGTPMSPCANGLQMDNQSIGCLVGKNGDLNWMVPGKLVAFSGPSARRLEVLVQN